MATGVYQFWKYWLRDRKYIEANLKAESNSSPNPLSLSSNAAFVFVILIIGLISAAFVFSVEHGVYFYKKYGTCQKLHLHNCVAWRSQCRVLNGTVKVNNCYESPTMLNSIEIVALDHDDIVIDE